MKKRFEWAMVHGCVLYRGVGLLAQEADPQPLTLFEEQAQPELAGRGWVRVKKVLSTTPDTALEDSLDTQVEGVEGQPSLSKTTVEASNREYRVSPSTPSTTSPVTISQSASEAVPRNEGSTKVPPTDPLPEGGTHPCTTRYEKRRQVAHKAAAMRSSVGYYWCEECEPQRLWMEFGEAKNYPSVDVPAHRFQVKQGREAWLQFAQEAGYRFVRYALEAVQPLRENEEI